MGVQSRNEGDEDELKVFDFPCQVDPVNWKKNEENEKMERKEKEKEEEGKEEDTWHKNS